MYWVTIIILLGLGLLAAGPMLAKGREELRQLVDALERAEAWVGVVAMIWGIYQLVFVVTHLGGVFHGRLLWGIIYLAIIALIVVLGFILGHTIIGQVIQGGPLKKWHDAIAPQRVSLGKSAAVTAAVSVILDLVS